MIGSRIILVIGAISLSLNATAVYAQAQPLKMKKGKAFVHKPSGVSLPATLLGMNREQGNSYYSNQLNISVQYSNSAQTSFLSVYIYRATAGSAAVWFDQARVPIESRAVYGQIAPAGPPTTVAFPGWSKSNALRVSYNTPGGISKSTGLMLGAVNGWMIKIRATSADHDVPALEKWMTDSIGQISWPKEDGSDDEAILMESCPDTLAFAADPKAVQEDSLLSGLLGSLIGLEPGSKLNLDDSEAKVKSPTKWCRDDRASLKEGNVYRADGAKDAYILTFSDAGFALSSGWDSVGGLIDAEMKEGAATEAGAGDDGAADASTKPGERSASRYYVNLHLPDKRTAYAARDGFPGPKVLLQILDSEGPVSEVDLSGKGNNIQIFTKGEK